MRFLLAGEWVDRVERLEVTDPYDLTVVDDVGVATSADVDAAVAAARQALEQPLSTRSRMDVLVRAADILDERHSEAATLIAREGIKTIREAEVEASRAVETLRLSSEEARRVDGETIRFDQYPTGAGRIGFTVREPVGVVAAITPFNDPLNLVANKVGPALAAGNTVIVKPDSKTPLSALLLGEILTEAGVPGGHLQVLPGPGRVLAGALAAHSDVAMVSFTGGVATGEAIAASAGLKRQVMELGANCPVIVHADADVDTAVDRIASGAFLAAGQNCLHVQRVYVHEEVADVFISDFVKAAEQVELGPKLDRATDMGPIIDVASMERIEAAVDEAVAAGAAVLTGGRRHGTSYLPTVLVDAPSSSPVVTDEIYGPVTVVETYSDLTDAIRRCNNTDFGLQGAVFTRDIGTAFGVAHALRCGGVMVNDSTDFRIDAMPFGGVGLSGVGREGVRSAVEEMTEPKVVCFADAVPVGS
ncbi:aldehyde dehydrogenase family protein [soil metagenome]